MKVRRDGRVRREGCSANNFITFLQFFNGRDDDDDDNDFVRETMTNDFTTMIFFH